MRTAIIGLQDFGSGPAFGLDLRLQASLY